MAALAYIRKKSSDCYFGAPTLNNHQRAAVYTSNNSLPSSKQILRAIATTRIGVANPTVLSPVERPRTKTAHMWRQPRDTTSGIKVRRGTPAAQRRASGHRHQHWLQCESRSLNLKAHCGMLPWRSELPREVELSADKDAG
jgi:hypothetical protein